jgi:hypothetical protein
VTAAATASCGSEVWLMKDIKVSKFEATKIKFLRRA